jgi:hypothetical protein
LQTSVVLALQVPWLGVAETKVAVENVSDTETLVASLEPLFTTLRV